MTPDGARQGATKGKTPPATTTPTPLSAAAPLGQRPTLRMQDGDIILEDGSLVATGGSGGGGVLAASPFASTPNNNHTPAAVADEQKYNSDAIDVGKSPVTPLPPGISADQSPMMIHQSSQLTSISLQAQPSRLATTFDNGSGVPTPTPEQARSATRSATGGGVGSFRLHFDVVESVRGAKYRTTELTASNVQQLTKQQYGGESSKASTTERMWRWLADAGPPYEVHPSVGVPSKPPLRQTSTDSRIKLPSCFSCFS
jgi:hypothetical protein